VTTRSRVLWSASIFVVGCSMKAALLYGFRVPYTWLDPLRDLSIDLANSVASIGSRPGRGWEYTTPLPNQIAWWLVYLGVFGLECVVALNLAWLFWHAGRRR